jgi:hypothetical protein
LPPEAVPPRGPNHFLGRSPGRLRVAAVFVPVCAAREDSAGLFCAGLDRPAAVPAEQGVACPRDERCLCRQNGQRRVQSASNNVRH